MYYVVPLIWGYSKLFERGARLTPRGSVHIKASLLACTEILLLYGRGSISPSESHIIVLCAGLCVWVVWENVVRRISTGFLRTSPQPFFSVWITSSFAHCSERFRAVQIRGRTVLNVPNRVLNHSKQF